jgi:hemerythrin-like metal-binding protein
MPLIEWKDEYAVGIPAVDHEHRTLIELINRLHARLTSEGAREAVIDFLGEVHAQISSHFALEEKIMRDLKYDGLAEHKADHESLLDDIRDIMDDYEAGAFDDAEGAFAERLGEWFGRHFRTLDARLHKFLEAKGVHRR